jgi:hypothetical protein
VHLRVLVGPNGRTPEVNYVRHRNDDDDAMTPSRLIVRTRRTTTWPPLSPGTRFCPLRLSETRDLPGAEGPAKC